jgi:hypothetical protein
MALEKFSEDLKSEPPRNVSAGKLDRNFRRCMPADRGQLVGPFAINESDEGWCLELRGVPSQTAVLGVRNGVLCWIETEACE